MKKASLCLWAFFLTFLSVHAKVQNTEEKKTENQSEEENKEKGKMELSGYMDSYYFTNFNRPASRDNMGQSGVGRGFDRRVDQFSLGMVQTVFKYTHKNSEAVADLAFGPNAQYGNYGNVPVLTPAYGYRIGNDNYSAIIIKQAFFKYNATRKLSFVMGQFGTHLGYEYIDAPLNFFYSINHTFNSGIPFYHTGLKSTYAFNDKISVMLGITNGFDYIYDNNRAKGIIGQLALTPAEGLSVYINYFSSNEANANKRGDTPRGNFTVFDLNGGYQLTDRVYIGYWLMYGSQYGALRSPGTYIPADNDTINTKHWGGANIYLVVKVSDLISIGFRGEHFDNRSGARALRNYDLTRVDMAHNPTGAVGAAANTFTFTGTLTLADGHLLLKPELRLDIWDKVAGVANKKSQQFMDANGDFTLNSQTTFGTAVIYKF